MNDGRNRIMNAVVALGLCIALGAVLGGGREAGALSQYGSFSSIQFDTGSFQPKADIITRYSSVVRARFGTATSTFTRYEAMKWTLTGSLPPGLLMHYNAYSSATRGHYSQMVIVGKATAVGLSAFRPRISDTSDVTNGIDGPLLSIEVVPDLVLENSGSFNCFIATAAYGSYLDPHVASLRSFRDRYLLTNAPGRAFVRFYYRHSPPVAAFIARHDSMRLLARLLLAPVIACVEHGGLVLGGVCLVVTLSFRRRRPAR